MSHTQTIEKTNDLTQDLLKVFQDLDVCIAEQEAIIVEERAAMKAFDAEQLTALVERRARCQSMQGELEGRCSRLINMSDTPQKMEYFIDRYAANYADDLQSMRIDLIRRMQILERDQKENHIRLRAAWNVTTSILQSIGAIEVNQTYPNTGYTRQAST